MFNISTSALTRFILAVLLLVMVTLNPLFSQKLSDDSAGNGIKNPQVYGTLSEHLDGSFYVTQLGKLRFKYQERYKDTFRLDFSIFDMQHNPVPVQVAVSPVKRYGMNWVELDLSGAGLVQDQYYVLEARNRKGDVLYQRFRYQ